jgi:hypothetical protein
VRCRLDTVLAVEIPAAIRAMLPAYRPEITREFRLHQVLQGQLAVLVWIESVLYPDAFVTVRRLPVIGFAEVNGTREREACTRRNSLPVRQFGETPGTVTNLKSVSRTVWIRLVCQEFPPLAQHE